MEEYAQFKAENLPISGVSARLDSDEKTHYKSLKDCCNQLLDAVDIGVAPVRSIKGLRILLNRPDAR